MSETEVERQILARFESLRQHQVDGKRSPHKPLLVLAVLGRFMETGSSVTPFSAIEERLGDLVESFGRPTRTNKAAGAAYPFTRLRRDGVWVLDDDVPMDNLTPLRASDVTGRFTPDIERALTASPELVRRLAHALVVSQFPSTLASDVLVQAGLDPAWAADYQTGPESTRRRSASWVRGILMAWDRQCAFCGYDGQLGTTTVGIEAAHVRWFNMGGPDDDDNGMALCALHHKLFDRGALGIDTGGCVKVSTEFTARTDVGRQVYELHGRPIRPRPGAHRPARAHVEWHDAEVFKG